MWHATASRLGLLPIQRILAEGSRRGASVEQFRALEVFGCTGERLTKHCAPPVRSVEVWEIDPSLEPALRRNLPTATVRITDSFAEIKRTLSRFDLVVVDNPVGCFGDGRCEHFDLFPDVARVLSDDSMLVLLVCSGDDPVTRARYPNLFDEPQLARRRSFYGVADPREIPLTELAAHYRRRLEALGMSVEWHVFRQKYEPHGLLPRRVGLYFLALKLRATEPRPETGTSAP